MHNIYENQILMYTYLRKAIGTQVNMHSFTSAKNLKQSLKYPKYYESI